MVLVGSPILCIGYFFRGLTFLLDHFIWEGKNMRLRENIPDLSIDYSWINGNVTNKMVQGYPTLIHFWSISCDICKDEMPKVNKLKEKYKGKIKVVAIHMPRSKEDKNNREINKVAATYALNQPILLDDELELTKKMGTKYVPAYYVFDSNGKLRHFQSGGGGFATLERRISKLV